MPKPIYWDTTTLDEALNMKGSGRIKVDPIPATKSLSGMHKGEKNPFFGYNHTKKSKSKISKNNGLGNKGKFGKNHPAYGHKVNENSKKNILKAHADDPWNKGKTGVQTHSTETKEKMSRSAKGKKKPTTQCPHCDKVGSVQTMKRWHFDNCKRS